jgi:N-acetylglucosaminyldiphosphoundecaprenol N-acetyl-beta-D-mannosaminyltransferase
VVVHGRGIAISYQRPLYVSFSFACRGESVMDGQHWDGRVSWRPRGTVADVVTSSVVEWARESAAFGHADLIENADPARSGAVVSVPQSHCLAREVYCVLGMPIDAIEMPAALRRIEAAVAAPFVLSTPNLNFLVISQTDPAFRESLLLSDLCVADGMPIVWIARILGIPIKSRIAGSDIFAALKSAKRSAKPLKVILFGGAEGVAAAAGRAINAEPGGLYCVGSIDPGFGTVDELSRAEILDAINSSDADFLVASLGAWKGQMWLQQNHDRLRVPIRAHLGAAVSFQAGIVTRAPRSMRKFGLEWMWRIKEEPHLWRRYWKDGRVLLRLLLTRVLPLAIETRWQRLRRRRTDLLHIRLSHGHDSVTLSLYGVATAWQVEQAIPSFRDAAKMGKPILIDLAETSTIDARFLGLLLMLYKQLKGQGASLKFSGASSRLRRMFRLNGAGFLLTSDQVA